MLHKTAEINLEEPGLAVEAKEFIVIKFVIFGSEWLDFSMTIRYLSPPPGRPKSAFGKSLRVLYYR